MSEINDKSGMCGPKIGLFPAKVSSDSEQWSRSSVSLKIEEQCLMKITRTPGFPQNLELEFRGVQETGCFRGFHETLLCE